MASCASESCVEAYTLLFIKSGWVVKYGRIKMPKLKQIQQKKVKNQYMLLYVLF